VTIAPGLLATILKRIINKRTVQEAMINRRWISYIKGALTMGALVDYLYLWDSLSSLCLQPNREDRHIFTRASDGKYSAKAAYDGLFLGSSSFGHHKRIGELGPPPNVGFLCGWWLITNVGLQTDWRKEA
jgi:hypothetical protein